MRLAIISDNHLGFKRGTPRFEDAFIQAEEAFTKAVERGADLILLGGDLFEKPVPPLEVVIRTLKILNLRFKHDSAVAWCGGKEVRSEALRGTPVLSLHGNHELRSKGQTNIMEMLEATGTLVYLHRDTIVLKIGDEKLAVHGMSHVPERYSLEALKQWRPRPVEGAKNVLMLHQSLGSFVFQDREQARIQLGDLPEGFDLYVCGHVHCRAEIEVRGKPLLFPGSTERTQLLETERVKGFYLVDLSDVTSWEFVELETPRDFFFEELRVEGVGLRELTEMTKQRVEEVLSRPRRNPKPPLIKLRLIGTLAKGVLGSEFDPQRIIEEFSDRALIEIDRTRLLSELVSKKAELVRELRERPLSLRDRTLRLLEEYLKDLVREPLFSITDLYHLLTEEKEEIVGKKVEEVLAARVRAEVED
ncbi:MAG: DNA repair exonuclease [Candidatus Hadarchaeales archaeon]